MTREVIMLDADVAEAISTALHRAEKNGHNLTEFEDEMWGYLTDAIQAKVVMKP